MYAFQVTASYLSLQRWNPVHENEWLHGISVHSSGQRVWVVACFPIVSVKSMLKVMAFVPVTMKSMCKYNSCANCEDCWTVFIVLYRRCGFYKCLNKSWYISFCSKKTVCTPAFTQTCRIKYGWDSNGETVQFAKKFDQQSYEPFY